MKNKKIIFALSLMLIIVCVLGYYFYKSNNNFIKRLLKIAEQSEIQAVVIQFEDNYLTAMDLKTNELIYIRGKI